MSEQYSQTRKIEQQRQHFDSIASRYVEARKDENHLFLKHLIWNYMLSSLSFDKSLSDQPTKKIKVLESMCGIGESYDILEKYLKNPIEYHGYDYSQEMVGAAKKQKPDFNIWHADATTWIPEDESYDMIILIGGLHHVPDMAQTVVQNLSLGLKKGGMFINFEPTHGNPLWRIIRERIYKNNSLFDKETERDFSVKELEGMFLSAGLKRHKLRYPGLLAYVLFYNPDAFSALNKGSKQFIRLLFNFETLFYWNFMGRFFSFATFSIWKK